MGVIGGHMVELLNYEPFSEPPNGFGENKPVGMASLKFTHGLTVNYSKVPIYPFQIGKDELPDVSKISDPKIVKYDIHVEVLHCLQKLQEHGWFLEITKFGIQVDDYHIGQNEVFIFAEQWTTNDSTNTISDLGYYLEDIVLELLIQDKAFSQEWYFANIARLYFDGGGSYFTENDAVTIGVLLGQMWWKFTHEENALTGERASRNIENATFVRMARAPKAKKKRLKAIRIILRELYLAHPDLKRNDSEAARRIEAYAKENIHNLENNTNLSREHSRSLILKKTGAVIGADAIRKHIISLRKDNQL